MRKLSLVFLLLGICLLSSCDTVKWIKQDAKEVHKAIHSYNQRREETHAFWMEWLKNNLGTEALVPTLIAWWFRERYHKKKERKKRV